MSERPSRSTVGNVRAPEAPRSSERLWRVKDLAVYLQRSPRWVQDQLARQPDEPGSIPHVLLPSTGRRRAVRFVPGTIRRWLELGCPPIRDFERLREGERGRR